MPARDILQLGNPLLHARSREVTDLGVVASVVRDLSDTLEAFRARSGFGRAIASPQIGRLERIVFVRLQPTGFAGALVNPSIERESPERYELWDDCFSFPDLMVRVARARSIRVAYQDEHGRPGVLEAEADLSELLQHEIDHLDGILAIERAVSRMAFCTRLEWERRYR